MTASSTAPAAMSNVRITVASCYPPAGQIASDGWDRATGAGRGVINRFTHTHSWSSCRRYVTTG